MAEIGIARWKGNKRFCYSITYDDGLAETLGFAWRLHRQYNIPGHINVSPTMLGKLTGDMSAGFLQSLWNLQKFAAPEHLQFLQSEGWTVGCQFPIDSANSVAPHKRVEYLEEQRRALEGAIGSPVRCLAFQDATSAPDWQDAACRAGFDWLLTLHDALNDPDDAATIIKRSPLYHLGAAPNHLANDPYRLLALARDRSAWVVDVVRLVDRFPRDPTRDCTPAELAARFKALEKIGAQDVWIATPETIADYRARRLASHIKDVSVSPQQVAFTLASSRSFSIPVSLTLIFRPDSEWRAPQAQTSDHMPIALRRSGDGALWIFECPAVDGIRVTITEAS